MISAVQKAIYDALVAANIPCVTTIRDTPISKPTSADFPFIEFGASQALPVDAGGDNGLELYVDVHCYSRSGGNKQMQDMMSAIYDALHHQTFTVTGAASCHCWLDRSRSILEPDGETRHGVHTFRIEHRK